MGQFLILPDAFIKYVAAFKRLPIPIDIPLETLRSVIEMVCLEVFVDAPSLREPKDLSEHRDISDVDYSPPV